MHNKIRQNPKSLIPDLEEMMNKFDGLLLKVEGKVTLRTKEGAAAVREAIDFLNEQQPVLPLKWNEHVAKAAKDHVKDIRPKGLI